MTVELPFYMPTVDALIVGDDEYQMKPQLFTKHDEATEVDVFIFCKCGGRFYLYVPDTMWACEKCRRIYRARVIVEIDETHAVKAQVGKSSLLDP